MLSGGLAVCVEASESPDGPEGVPGVRGHLTTRGSGHGGWWELEGVGQEMTGSS